MARSRTRSIGSCGAGKGDFLNTISRPCHLGRWGRARCMHRPSASKRRFLPTRCFRDCLQRSLCREHAVFPKQFPNQMGDFRVLLFQGGEQGCALLFVEGERLVQVRTNFPPTLGTQCGHGSVLQVGRNGSMQIDPCFLPVSLHGSLRGALHRGNLAKGKSAEEL